MTNHLTPCKLTDQFHDEIMDRLYTIEESYLEFSTLLSKYKLKSRSDINEADDQIREGFEELKESIELQHQENN